MDVSLYEVVLSYRRGERLSDAIEYGFTEAQLALRRDMAAGRLIWYENWLQDWWCFLRNTHPVFAAFASHQLHVVGKLERYWIYFMLICAYWCARRARPRARSRASARARLARAHAARAAACRGDGGGGGAG